jgi:AcrR family transcriptional regulator
MADVQTPKQQLLLRVLAHAAEHGLADHSLRSVATGVGTSHRMLLYHFGSRQGLLAEIVAAVEDQQRTTMLALGERATSPHELMLAWWRHLSRPELRPAVRLFFEVLGLAAQGAPGTERLLAGLTDPWLEDGARLAQRWQVEVDRRAIRVGVAVTRGLLLDLLAGADPAEVDAAYRAFADLYATEATVHHLMPPVDVVRPR